MEGSLAYWTFRLGRALAIYLFRTNFRAFRLDEVPREDGAPSLYDSVLVSARGDVECALRQCGKDADADLGGFIASSAAAFRNLDRQVQRQFRFDSELAEWKREWDSLNPERCEWIPDTGMSHGMELLNFPDFLRALRLTGPRDVEAFEPFSLGLLLEGFAHESTLWSMTVGALMTGSVRPDDAGLPGGASSLRLHAHALLGRAESIRLRGDDLDRMVPPRVLGYWRQHVYDMQLADAVEAALRVGQFTYGPLGFHETSRRIFFDGVEISAGFQGKVFDVLLRLSLDGGSSSRDRLLEASGTPLLDVYDEMRRADLNALYQRIHRIGTAFDELGVPFDILRRGDGYSLEPKIGQCCGTPAKTSTRQQ